MNTPPAYGTPPTDEPDEPEVPSYDHEPGELRLRKGSSRSVYALTIAVLTVSIFAGVSRFLSEPDAAWWETLLYVAPLLIWPVSWAIANTSGRNSAYRMGYAQGSLMTMTAGLLHKRMTVDSREIPDVWQTRDVDVALRERMKLIEQRAKYGGA